MFGQACRVAVGLAAAAVLPAQTPLGLDAYVPAPAGNPLVAQKVKLGRKLFFDKDLSRDRTVSCASCHLPELGFTDEHPVAVGIESKKGARRTPALINRAWGQAFFWDGRAASLEDQVLKPIANPIEMDLPVEEAAARAGLSVPALRDALASYVRTILSGDSPYDRYVAGDQNALSAEARRGLEVFRGKGNCIACHVGPNLTDEQFHNTGMKSTDAGRSAVTHNPADQGAFKTPTLRDAARRPPYMHDGSLATLEDVIEHYDKGGEVQDNLDPEIQPLHLTAAEKKALKAFLESVNGTIQEGSWPGGEASPSESASRVSSRGAPVSR